MRVLSGQFSAAPKATKREALAYLPSIVERFLQQLHQVKTLVGQAVVVIQLVVVNQRQVLVSPRGVLDVRRNPRQLLL